MDIEIEGLDAILSKLNNIDESSVKELVTGIARASDLVTSDAKANAPVRTGHLRDSIQSMGTTVSSDEVTGGVETDCDYAEFVELGTSKMAAEPFMYPAAATNKQKVQDIISVAVEKAIKEA